MATREVGSYEMFLEAMVTGAEAYSLAAGLLLPRARVGAVTSCGWCGSGMIGARIEDGDLLVVEGYQDMPDGTVVVGC